MYCQASYDLTLATFVFSEVEDISSRKNMIESIWKRTNDVFAVVDRGTPSSFKRMLELRDQILATGEATIIAPVCGFIYFFDLIFICCDQNYFFIVPPRQRVSLGIPEAELVSFLSAIPVN
jgi:ribosomal protein RSM22 (predicted rRNA methylase)